MDRMVTKTMAELYLQQGHLEEAYEIYKALIEKDPFDPELQKRAEELKERLHPSPSPNFPSRASMEERVRSLEKWLDNIRKRKRT